MFTTFSFCFKSKGENLRRTLTKAANYTSWSAWIYLLSKPIILFLWVDPSSHYYLYSSKTKSKNISLVHDQGQTLPPSSTTTTPPPPPPPSPNKKRTNLNLFTKVNVGEHVIWHQRSIVWTFFYVFFNCIFNKKILHHEILQIWLYLFLASRAVKFLLDSDLTRIRNS